MKNQGRNSPELKILGIDPGSIHCGYGLISSNGRVPKYITSGRISPPAARPLSYRLKCIHEALMEIIKTFHPDTVSVEKIFFAKGVKAALSLGHARGIILLAAASEEVELHEYSALEVKKAVVGYGRAEKRQVQEMVKAILNIKGELYPDSADALALALCHMNTIKFSDMIKNESRT